MAALSTNPTRSHADQGAAPVLPINPESPLTTGVFSNIFSSHVRGQVFVAYNMELAQRGLIALQIPGGEDAQIVEKDKITEIARPDLFLRVCEAVCSRLGLGVDTSIPALALTTRNYFNPLHTLNVEHSHNIRGEVNFRYNQLLLRNSVNKNTFPLIPRSDLEELELGGYEGHLAHPLHAKWYAKAFADVVGERDCFLRFPGLSVEESIMDKLDMDPVRAMLSRLSPHDLAVSKGVCKAWCVEARWLEKQDVVRPIIGPIEAQFPSHQVIGPQFWAELKAMPSYHPDSAGHPEETIGAFLMRKSDQCIAEAAALENPDAAQRLRCRAEGYMLNCKGTWTRSQVISLYQMMGSVEVEENRGCGLVLKPKEYDLVVHMDILAAMGIARSQAPGFTYIWQPVLDAQRGAPSSGSVTLSALTNGLVSGTHDMDMDEREARVRALNCEVPELLNLLIHIHFTWVKTAGTYLYGQDPSTYSLVQESVGGRRLMIGNSTPRGLNVFGYFGTNDSGAGAQRKCRAIGT